MSDPQTDDTMIAALLREREGLVQRGLKDRVAQVDEQLRLRGYEDQRGIQQQKAPETPSTPEPTPPQTPEAQKEAEAQQRAEAPKGRQPRGSQKA
jgi:hypothetical protein